MNKIIQTHDVINQTQEDIIVKYNNKVFYGKRQEGKHDNYYRRLNFENIFEKEIAFVFYDYLEKQAETEKEKAEKLFTIIPMVKSHKSFCEEFSGLTYAGILERITIIDKKDVNNVIVDCLKQRQTKTILSHTKEEKEKREKLHEGNLYESINSILRYDVKKIYKMADEINNNIDIRFNCISVEMLHLFH